MERSPAPGVPPLFCYVMRPFVEPNPVHSRIVAVIGVHPSRSELIAIAQSLGWGPLSRGEKRSKALLVQRLESMRNVLLPFLDTPEGRRALETSFRSIRRDKQMAASPPTLQSPIPPEATVAYYLNHFGPRQDPVLQTA